MKLRTYINIFCIAGMLSFLAACKKDFLDVVPTDRLSEEALLADSTLFESFVTNRYLGVRLQDKEDIPGFGRTFSAGYSINNKGFIGGGYSPLALEFKGYLKDFWQYDQETDSWIQLPNLPGVGRQGPVGFSIGNDGYIGTGYNVHEGYEQSDIYVFKLDN